MVKLILLRPTAMNSNDPGRASIALMILGIIAKSRSHAVIREAVEIGLRSQDQEVVAKSLALQSRL